MPVYFKIKEELITCGADFVYFVDISHLPSDENRGYSHAILLGIALSCDYLQEVLDTPDYVKGRVENSFDFDDDELYLTELKTDKLSDHIVEYLKNMGYHAYSQSDRNLLATNAFDEANKKTLLPHKTIATLAGLGWIGKNNLLVTPAYGSALCIGTVLTDAPVPATKTKPLLPKCGKCSTCLDICDVSVLKGHIWSTDTKREDIIDVYNCTTCMKCLVCCPWTQAYVKRNKKKK